MSHRHRTAALAAFFLVMAAVAAAMFFTDAPVATMAALGGHFPSDPGSLLFAAAGPIAIAELRQRRSTLIKEMEALAAGEQTDQTRADFDKKEKEVQGIDEDIRRAEALENLRRSAAHDQAPNDHDQGGGGNGDQQRNALATGPGPAAQPLQQRDLGFEFGAFIRSYAASQLRLKEGLDVKPPSKIAAELYGERHHVTQALERSQQEAQQASSGVKGGFTIPPTYSNTIVEGFKPAAIVRPIARVVPGNAVYLKGVDTVFVDYIGENDQPNLTGVSFGLMSIGERDFGAILPISKKLLRASAVGVEAYCRQEMERGGARFEDKMFLFGDGVGKRVKGLAYAIPTAQRFAAVNKVDPTHVEVRKDLRKILGALANADVPVDQNGPAWLMHPVVKMYLEDLYVGDVKAFPTLEGPNPTLMGYPVKTSTQIAGPGSANGSMIFFGAFNFALIGETVSMTITTSDQATVKDSNGNLINFWAQDMLGLRLGMTHDFALQHEVAFGMLHTVKWGA